MSAVLWFFVGYLAGSIPVGYIISRHKGIDIRRLGSGNIGAANVYRALGAKWAILTALGDVLKGFLPVVLSPNIYAALAASFGAVTGSIFSLFLSFRGGKGFATSAGSFLGLLTFIPRWDLLILLVVNWLSIVVFSRFTSLANIVTVLTAIPASACARSLYLTLFFVYVVIMISYSHRENIRRLLEGREHTFLEKVSGREKW